jgi:hypothetical protein
VADCPHIVSAPDTPPKFPATWVDVTKMRLFVVEVNCAVIGEFIVTVHVAPEQRAGSQALMADEATPLTVSLTAVPSSKLALVEQIGPLQLIPAGDEVMLPPLWPAPIMRRFTVKSSWTLLNVAVTVVAVLSVTEHVPVPLQPPPNQPANVDVPSGVAVSDTIGLVVVRVKPALQVAPQLMAADASVTVPPPLPAFDMVSVTLS